MRSTMYVFTSPTCPHCPLAKATAAQVAKERDDVMLKEVVSGMGNSNGLFKKYEVRSVPTTIIKGPGYPSNIGLRGVQPARTLHKYVDLSLGITHEEERKEGKGLLSRLRSAFATLEE